VARDDARDGDQQVRIGDLTFLIDDEMERSLTGYGGLQIGYSSSPWGGGFTIQFSGVGGGCC
jgi:hypothetical protein